MAIRYKLVPNKLTNEPNTYLGCVYARDTARMEDIVARIVERDNTVGKVDVIGVLEALISVVEKLIQEGNSISTSLFNIRVTMSGVFDGQLDAYDPERHQLNVRVTPGTRLSRALRDVSVVQADKDDPHPWPKSYYDVVSGMHNSVLTPGGMGNLVGRLLRFDPEDSEQGVFMIALADKSEVRVEVVGKNTLRELFFTVPALSPGEYQLAVRAKVAGCTQMRTGLLEATLTVAG